MKNPFTKFMPLLMLGESQFLPENKPVEIHKEEQSEESKEYYLKKAEEKRLRKIKKRLKNT